MNRRTRVLMLGGLTILAASVPAAGASACSCAGSEGWTIKTGDAAVIARLVDVVTASQRAGGGGEPVGIGTGRFRYRVRRVFEGPDSLHRGKRLSIRSSMSGASCGLPQERKRYGIFLERNRRKHRWEASLCSVVAPREIRRIARGDAKAARSACPRDETRVSASRRS